MVPERTFGELMALGGLRLFHEIEPIEELAREEEEGRSQGIAGSSYGAERRYSGNSEVVVTDYQPAADRKNDLARQVDRRAFPNHQHEDEEPLQAKTGVAQRPIAGDNANPSNDGRHPDAGYCGEDAPDGGAGRGHYVRRLRRRLHMNKRIGWRSLGEVTKCAEWGFAAI